MAYQISEERLEQLFPAYLEVDGELKIRGVGSAIRRSCQPVRIGDPLSDHFVRVGCSGDPELSAAVQQAEPIRMRSVDGRTELRGSVLDHGDGYLLALAIVPTALLIGENDLQISDFGPNDPTVEGLLLISLQKAMLEEAQSFATDLAKERQRSLDIMERVSRAAGYLGHDFNNLLSIIRLNCDRLLADSGMAAQQQRLVRIILETSERGSELTRSLMTLSHQRNNSRTVLNLDGLIGEHAAFFSTIAGSKIAVRFNLDAPAALVEVPRVALVNCLMNLIINSRDAMPEGGEITISTDVRTASLSLASKGDAMGPKAYVTVEIADDGPGMKEEVIKRAFEPFFSTKAHGSGIGLASVMDFALEMGGSACLDSHAGKGTAVYLYLPASSLEGDAPCADAPQASTPASTSGARVMVVEDEPYALEALTEMLESDGYRVSTACSAAEAMAILESQPHQVLLTDVVMPQTSGIDLAEWAARMAPDMGIILMSGYVPDSEEMRPEWRFIRKPLTIADLREMLRITLSENSAGR